MVGQKTGTLKAQIPGACTYDVLVQNTGETAWTGTLELKPPTYKIHHLRNVKCFHNGSAHEAETGIGIFWIHFLKICST